MVNYANSKIYKIVGGGLTYIGSTTRPLSERFYEHKSRSSKCSARVVLEHSDACIVLIENYSCENKEQLLARERHWVDTSECVNLLRPILYERETQELKKEYYEANKEEFCIHSKEYYEKTKVDEVLKKKQYYEENRNKFLEKINCSICNKCITRHSLKRHIKTQHKENTIEK